MGDFVASDCVESEPAGFDCALPAETAAGWVAVESLGAAGFGVVPERPAGLALRFWIRVPPRVGSFTGGIVTGGGGGGLTGLVWDVATGAGACAWVTTGAGASGAGSLFSAGSSGAEDCSTTSATGLTTLDLGSVRIFDSIFVGRIVGTLTGATCGMVGEAGPCLVRSLRAFT